MSHISTPLEFDFWEFVSCGICHLEYIDETGALSSVPFWLTECGHVVCNNHLNADQSCAECRSTGIHVLAMARDVRRLQDKVQEVPYSWHGSWNHRWRTGLSPLPPLSMQWGTHSGYVTYCSVRVLAHRAVARSQFQLTTMASLARFYKKKYLQYRPLYERLKEEHAEAKRLRKYSFT
ncbi:hypothetical protein V8D89_011121 [Ganoderma adspersum]